MKVRAIIPLAACVAAVIVPSTDASARVSWHRSIASWYGPCPDACGRAACTGQFIHENTWGVAHKTLPCGTKVTICRGRRCVRVRVIDRGPYVSGRTWDITKRPAARIGLTPAVGVSRVRWHLGWRRR